MARSNDLMKMGAGVAVGLAGGYLCDPAQGRSRRARLKDQARSTARHRARAVTQRARYERGRIVGLRHRMTRGHEARQVDDRTLVDRVRSQALARMPELAHRITVDASGGVVTVRGELELASDIELVVGAVRGTPGVEGVTNLLHLSGEVAPNKAAAPHSDAG